MGTSTGKERDLNNAKRVITATMKLKMAKLLFNQPVDPEALGLPNYFTVVKEPMDLGTILHRLSAGEQQGWDKCEYHTAEEVYRDVSLVWHNCALYNSREVDKPTRDAAIDVKAAFDQNWKEAGLSNVSEKPAEPRVTTDLLRESSVPQSVGTTQEGLSLPLRVLDSYKILQVSTGRPADLLQAWSTPLTAQGDTLALDIKNKKQKQTFPISTGPILDWCFTYGAEPSIFIATELAWYKLTTPAGDYAQFQQQMQQRLHLCITAVKLLKNNSSLTPLAAAESAYDEAVDGDANEEQAPIISFVQAQVAAWMEATATGGAGSKKAKTKLMSGLRIGKAGLAVSGKTAASAAVEAASQAASLPSAGKKRKAKPTASSPEQTQKKGKKRRVEDAAAEGTAANEATPETARTRGARRSRPPRPPAEGAITPSEPGHKLGSNSEGKMSRLGKEARAAGHDPKGSSSHPDSASADSKAGSGAESDGGDNKNSQAQPKEEGVSGRRTRQASLQLEPAWLEPEETPPKHKSRRRNKGKSSAFAKVKAEEQAKRESYDAGRSRIKREKEEHSARGPIPTPCRDFRLPQRQVPALLMIWELTQALGSLLQLAPCPFWRLEAAIAPGPRLPPEEPPSTDEAAASDASAPVEINPEGQPQDADEPDKQAANNKVSDEKPKGSKKARGNLQAAPRQADTGIDSAGSASTVVLRELHCALLRITQSQGVERDKKDAAKGQPTTAKLFSPDSSGLVPWTAQVAQAILASPAVGSAATAKGAALKLAYMEYADLQLEERLALLQALLEQALDCEVVRELITSKVEALALPRHKKPPGKEAGTPGPAQEGIPNPKELEVTAQPGSCEEWLGWMEACRVGWRKPLGQDMQRRRYWALGGSTGCWRVYVEEQEGALWGWYQGEGVINLVEWLKAATIEREAGLLKALSQIPMPKKVPTEGHSSKHTISTNSEEAGELLSSSELDARRPDGFKFITAPVLRGEGNWPSISLYAPMEQRIHSTVDALLARIPFWLKGETWLARHAHVLQAVEKARSGGDVAKALLFVERMLVEQLMMQPQWEQHFQAPWRHSLAKCNDSRQAILYLAALQEHMVVNSDVLPRHGFTQMARNMRCQLYFPFPTEQVVLLRTGVLVHINAYMRSLGLTPPAADPAAASTALPQHTRTGSSADAGPVSLKAQVANAGLSDQGPVQGNGVAHMADAMEVDSPGGDVPSAGHEASDGQLNEGPQAVMSTGAGTAAVAGAAASDWLGRIRPDDKEELQQVWEHLKETVEALPHVGCYSIASVAYRRSLVETLPEDEEAVLSGQQARRPVAWLLLRPARGQGQQRQPQRAIALPISCDASLPDYIVKPDVFEKGMRRHWHKHDRFRMFFASSYTNKTGGGVYYKGTVTKVQQQMPAGGINLQGRQDYDPWEALDVEWDVGGDAEGMDHISPWEIENDPEEERRLLEDQRKAQEAAARSARLEAKAAKARRMAQGLYTDEEDEAGGSPFASGDYSDSAGIDVHDHESPPTHSRPTPRAGQGSPEPRRQDAAASRDVEREIAEALAADAAFLEDPSMTLREGALLPREAGQEEGGYELPALSAGGTISKDVLDLVRGQDKDSFTCLLINWYRRAKGKYKVPTFAHQELDLHKVFWEVQDKGGYDQVTNFKLWKEICRSLDLDLRGQTSASYNMRLNYEKCLLEFERYLALGRYSADLAQGTAPPTHHLEAPPAIKPVQGTGFVPGVAVPVQGTRSSARLAAAGPTNPFSTTDELDELSFTELLNMDLEADDNDMAPLPASSPQRQEALPLPLSGVSSVTRPRSRRGGPGTAPKGSQPPQQSAAVSSQADAAGMKTSGGGPSMGALLQGLGRRLAGKKVMRHWPDNGGWWEADVDTYNASTGQHRLSYDEGEDEESFEWVDFRELTDQEVTQHPSYVVLHPRPPPAPAPAPPAAAAAKPGPKAGSSNTEQAAMNAIMAALRSGIAPGVVHSMVNMAAAALRITAPGPTPASPPRHWTLPADPRADHPGHASPRPFVSSFQQPQGQVKKGLQAGLKSVLKTGAVRDPGEHRKVGRAESDAAAGTEGPAMLDAPYSFRRHRRMDLQPQPAAIPPQPAVSQPATAAQRIKRKHPSSEAEVAPDTAAPEVAEPVRTSVRVKLRRSGSAGKQPASSSALSGKQLSEARGKPRHRHRHRHTSQAVPREEDRGIQSVAGRPHHTEALTGDMAGSRMHSSGPGYSQELTAHGTTWQSGSGNLGAEAVHEEHSGESSQAAASAASGHSKSEQVDADQAAAAFDSEAASGGHAEHAAAMLSHGHMPSPTGDEQAVGQSHVTGPPHSQAQQGGSQMPRDTARSDLDGDKHLRALSMTESTPGADVAVHGQAEPTLHKDGVPSTQACRIGISGDEPAAANQNEQHSMPAAGEQSGGDSEEQEWLHSSSVEVASPQQPMRQTGTEGSKSVDQVPARSKGIAEGHGADDDRAESQLRAARQLQQPK